MYHTACSSIRIRQGIKRQSSQLSERALRGINYVKWEFLDGEAEKKGIYYLKL